MFGLPPIRDIKRLRESLDLGLGRSGLIGTDSSRNDFAKHKNGMVAVFLFWASHALYSVIFPIPSFRPAARNPWT